MALDAMFCVRIRNVVAKEGEERTLRHVKVDVWRRFVARYRMVETSYSESSLYQSNLVVKKFAYGDSCTLGENDKNLTVG
ncbi:hypothetical protein K1719_024748 [Acacia pycnantha]|nr:hypothetical protein K1719_024748 [Acacia pycnantha]